MEVACVLIPDSALADPVEAGELTELLLRRLERIGAAVESERIGEAFFALDGLRGIHGGESAGVLAAARRGVEMQVRIGVAPTRFAAHAAARRETIVPLSAAGDFLAGLPVSALAGRLELPPREAGSLVEAMRRLGIETLGGSRRSPTTGWPIGLASLGWKRSVWPVARTRRCARAGRTRSSPRSSSCPKGPRADSWTML
jgi:hypothetical protein